jgi:hypothetical protein
MLPVLKFSGSPFMVGSPDYLRDFIPDNRTVFPVPFASLSCWSPRSLESILIVLQQWGRHLGEFTSYFFGYWVKESPSMMDTLANR